MASLGSFAAAAREYEPKADPDTFEFAGETFTVRGAIPGMVHLTVGASTSGKLPAADFAAAVMETLRHALTSPAHDAEGETVPADESEWLRFHELAIANGVKAEHLRDLAYELLAADMGRPTRQRSDS
jgi:hypothetical protein